MSAHRIDPPLPQPMGTIRSLDSAVAEMANLMQFDNVNRFFGEMMSGLSTARTDWRKRSVAGSTRRLITGLWCETATWRRYYERQAKVELRTD